MFCCWFFFNLGNGLSFCMKKVTNWLYISLLEEKNRNSIFFCCTDCFLCYCFTYQLLPETILFKWIHNTEVCSETILENLKKLRVFFIIFLFMVKYAQGGGVEDIGIGISCRICCFAVPAAICQTIML